MFVYRVVKLFEENSKVADCQRSGRSRAVCMPETVKAVYISDTNHLENEKSYHAKRKFLVDQSLTKSDLKLSAYKEHTSHLLIDQEENKKNKVK